MKPDPSENRFGLEQPSAPVPITGAADDARPKMPEPPPVRLVSIREVTLPAVAGREVALDAFYGSILGFVRSDDVQPEPNQGPVYQAENHDLRFHLVERPPEREECRPIGIVSARFAEVLDTLIERRIEHEYVRGLVGGQDGVLLRDPAGNWLAILPLREVR